MTADADLLLVIRMHAIVKMYITFLSFFSLALLSE